MSEQLLALPWKPLDPENIQDAFGEFRNWTLCGGFSIDMIVGRKTREHADIDIGVFRSQAEEALRALNDLLPYLCDPPGKLRRWNGEKVPERIYDIWLLDRKASSWVMQVMIFDDDGETVYFKRDKSIFWSKENHAIVRNGIRVLNPMITMLYKITSSDLREKDYADLHQLIKTTAV